MKPQNLFFIPPTEETAHKYLAIHNGDWSRAKRSALTMVDKHRPLQVYRRHYAAVYIWLLLNEPTPRLIGAVPSITALKYKP